MSGELVSVIVPCYNAEKYLAETLESILRQTYSPLEVIVIDDGSTDRTQDVAKTFGEKIRYIYQKNAGPSVARNRGMFKSKGPYLAFCDADDLWLEDKIRIQMEVFEKNDDCAMVATNGIFVNEEVQDIHKFIVDPSISNDRLHVISIDDMLSWARLYPSSVIIKKDAIYDAGLLFDSKTYLFENVFLWLRIIEQHKAIFVNDLLIKRRYFASSLSHAQSKKDRYAQIKVYSLALVDFPESKKRLRENLLHSLYSTARLEAKDRDFRRAKALFGRAVKIDPFFGRLYFKDEDAAMIRLKKLFGPFFFLLRTLFNIASTEDRDW